MQQQYSREDSVEFIRNLIPLFRDSRYMCVDARPLLLIYKAGLIPDIRATVALWREEARAAGFPDLYLLACQTAGEKYPDRLGFDAGVEFPPHGHHAIQLNARFDITNPAFNGLLSSYRSQIVQSLGRPPDDFKLFRCVMPAWDNTARRHDKATIFTGSSPELFQYWLEQMIYHTRARHRGEERLLFINAWNEWGEGCHLEPDQRYGWQYLEALRSAIASG